jgi:hypothetical protein
MPTRSVVCVAQRLVEIVVNGDIKRDCEIKRPATKESSRGVPLGTVLYERWCAIRRHKPASV